MGGPGTTTSPFLSTLSLRRATAPQYWRSAVRLISIHALLAESDEMPIYGTGDYEHFYPRSPCGERRYTPRSRRRFPDISIHALLAESDLRQRRAQSVKDISIHALLAESDYSGHDQFALLLDFYPRSPCGERRIHQNWRKLH